MPTETGIWTEEEAKSGHLFSEVIASMISKSIDKETTVIDLGCGNGAYLRYLLSKDFRSLIGIDGSIKTSYNIVEFPFSRTQVLQFIKDDLTTPIIFPEQGNVICLEVGEHIPKEHENVFIDNVVNHVKPNGMLFLSWAIPGQDGIGHVNCKPNEEVIKIFQDRGFDYLELASNSVRSLVEDELAYFKNTIMIFVRK